MPRFLTQEWVDAFNEAMSDVVVADPGADAGHVAQTGRFVVAEEVRGAPEGEITLLLMVDEGKVRLLLAAPTDRSEAGGTGLPDREPNVTIALSYQDAVAMAKGDVTPAQALNAGSVRVRGDLAVLVAGQQVLAEAKQCTAALTAQTTY